MSEPVVLAPGIILFPNSFDRSRDMINLLNSLKEDHFQRNYKIVKKQSLEDSYVINKSGHRIFFSDLNKSCYRIDNLRENDKQKKLVNNLEDVIYKKLIQYIEFYPQLLPCLWWKTKGHGLIYNSNSALGIHADNDINYYPNFEPDYQLGIRHVLSCTVYFNSHSDNPEADQFSGGEIVFPYLNVIYKPEAGDVLMFPSNYLASHEVMAVTSGIRYLYLEYFGQGSSDANRGISIVDDSSNISNGQVWIKNLFTDYEKYIMDKHPLDYGNYLRSLRNNLNSFGTREEVNDI